MRPSAEDPDSTSRTPLDVPGAWDLFSTPPRWPLTAETSRVLDEAERVDLVFPDARMEPGETHIACYRWRGDGSGAGAASGSAVVLIHGWGGRAAQLAGLVGPLVRRGLGVIAADAPAHGESGGTRTNVYEFARTAALALELGGAVRGIVGHSLGATAAAIALHRNVAPGGTRARTSAAVGRLALLSPLTSLYDEVTRFARDVGLDREVEAGMRRHMGAYFHPEIWRETTLSELAPALGLPALIVHDEDDPKVPYTDGARLARTWPGSSLHSTSGLGHRAPLRSEEVSERVADYLTDASGSRD